jgi:uncharacterized membrane protein
MSNLIVVGFDHLDDARHAMQALRQIEHEGLVHFEDTALIERTADGKTHVRNEASSATETGAVVGGLLGALLVLIAPPLGVVIGAAAGAAIGSLLGTGVDRDFVDDVKQSLSPGRSALFLVVQDGAPDAIFAALRPFSGEVLQSTLSPEAEDELRRSLEG